MLSTRIHTSRFLPAAALMVVAALTASAATARAGEFAMITIENGTTSTIPYQFRWGSDGEWEDHTLYPGEYANHAYPLDDDGNAPTPYIRFDNGHGTVVEYRLNFYASDSWGFHRGKLYGFEWYGSYLDLRTR